MTWLSSLFGFGSILDWFKLRLTMVVVVIAASALAGGAGYAKGVWDTAQRSQTGELLARIKTLENDRDLAERLAKRAESTSKVIEERSAALEQKVTDYEAELLRRALEPVPVPGLPVKPGPSPKPKRPEPDRCALNGADVRSLRNIR